MKAPDYSTSESDKCFHLCTLSHRHRASRATPRGLLDFTTMAQAAEALGKSAFT